MFFNILRRTTLAVGLLIAGSTPVFAHAGPMEHGSFIAGFMHPLSGIDHILVMVAIGLWAALIGGRAIWLVPCAFVATMVVGLLLALGGLELPLVEPMILASVTVLGLFVAFAWKLQAAFAMTLAAFFALFHGYAHGGEMGSAWVLTYGLGFTLATALLHLVGIGFGSFIGSRHLLTARLAGIGTAFTGLWLAFSP